MDEGLVALLQIICLLIFAGFCLKRAVRMFRKNMVKGKAADTAAKGFKEKQSLKELEDMTAEQNRQLAEVDEIMQRLQTSAPHEKEQLSAELENTLRRHTEESKARHEANAYKFPDPEVAEIFLQAGLCSGPQVESLISAGYKTVEAVAQADPAIIKKLPKFGPKSAPVTINAARRKLDLPPLPL